MTTNTPLLTPNGLVVCDKFSTDLADLCNAASAAGMTPNMICGQLNVMAMMISFEVKDAIDATPAPPVAPQGLTAGSTATFTLGSIATPASDMQVLAVAVGPYSIELKYGAHDGFTYTAGTLWPGITLYGQAGDLVQMVVGQSTVTVSISQDRSVTWTPFFVYARTETGSLQPHVDATAFASVAQTSVTP